METLQADYETRIAKLENEINYLHSLLDQAGIPYQTTAFPAPSTPSYSDGNLRQNAMEQDQGARILPEPLTQKHAAYFYTVFKGRKDVYSKRGGKPNPKTGKTGYYTQCHNFWKAGICPRRNQVKTKCSECARQSYKELTGQVLLKHLLGESSDASDVVGLYVMLPDETCNFLVFDFDNHETGRSGEDGANLDDEWIREVNAMRDICRENDVPIVVERSRSGKGAHLWMFFEEPVPALVARQFGSALLTKGADSVNLKTFQYYDRMLPAQDYAPLDNKTGKPGLGNLIALPLQGQALKYGNSAFIDEEWNAYPNQWQIINEIKRISRSFIDQKISEWGEDGILGVFSAEFCGADNASNEPGDYQQESANALAGQEDVEKHSRNSFTQQKDNEQHPLNPSPKQTDASPNKPSKKTQTKPWEKKALVLHAEDISGELNLTLADKLYIETANLKPRLQNRLRRMAAFSNPEFYKNMKMGFSTQGTPRIIFCGYDEGGYLCLPRALDEPVLGKLKDAGIKYSLTDQRQSGRNIKVQFTGELYDEQKAAATAMLQHENGILGAATAFGKTVVGAYLVAARRVNTLILVHNTEILKNWAEDLEKFLKIDESLPEYKTATGRIKKRKSVIGKLSAGHNSMTGIIDVAMFSSLGKKDDINPVIEEYGMVIMDECHHGAAQTVEDVIGSVKAKYIYGLTATPRREDGMEKKVYMQFGPIRFRYTAKDRAAKQGINHYIYPRLTRLVSPDDLKIHEAYQAVVESELRNEQIINDIEACLQNGRTPLVLSKYKAHTEILYHKLQGKAEHVFLLQGGGSRKEKDALREEMKAVPANESVVLVAIDKYIGEGFNYPRLDTMMLAMPIAWEGNVEQYAGRLHRDYAAKQEVIIYDYVDTHIRILEKMYHKRLRAYRKIGYEICLNLTEVKQQANAIFDAAAFVSVYERDLLEANAEIIIASPGLNKAKVTAFLRLIQKRQESGVKITVVTLNPESYPAERIEAAKQLVEQLWTGGVNVKLRERMHEHFAVIDREIVWYGSVNLLSKAREEDNLMRVESREIAQELLELTF